MASGPYSLGTLIPVEVTFDQPGLFVAATFYQWNGSTWVVVGSPIAMLNIASTNGYACVFTPDNTGQYYVSKIAYTDDTYTTPNPDEPEGSDSFPVVVAAGSSGESATDLFGFLLNNEIIGLLPK